MGWKKFVSLHHKIENINLFTIKINNIKYDTNNNCYDAIITKASPFEYQIDTYYHNTNILTDSEIKFSIRNYIKS